MINEQISDKAVRLIGTVGEEPGIMPTRDSVKIVSETELDLIKIALTAKPPICKIIDYGEYKYELLRKEKEVRKKQRIVEIKEVCH